MQKTVVHSHLSVLGTGEPRTLPNRAASSAGELYPTEVRTTAHGFSAGFAKLGALWATIFFNYIGFRARFW